MAHMMVRESGHQYHRRSEVNMQGDAALAHAQHMGMLPPPRMSGHVHAHAHAHAHAGVNVHAHAHAGVHAHAHAHAQAYAHAGAVAAVPQQQRPSVVALEPTAGAYHAYERKSKVKVKVSGVVEDPAAMMMPPARHSAVPPMYTAAAPVAAMPMPQQRHSAVVMAGAHAHAHSGVAVSAPMMRPSAQVMVPMKVRESKTKIKAKTKTKERTVMVPMNI